MMLWQVLMTMSVPAGWRVEAEYIGGAVRLPLLVVCLQAAGSGPLMAARAWRGGALERRQVLLAASAPATQGTLACVAPSYDQLSPGVADQNRFCALH